MKKPVMLIDLDRCIGCLSCEVACVQEKGIENLNIRPMKVFRIEGMAERPDGFFLPMNCFHCDPAPCVLACPTSAMRKREKDGVVYLEELLCIGCKACIIACPYGAITFNPSSQKVEKCDYCFKRIDQGLLPSCVSKCVTNCLYFVEVDQTPRERHLVKRIDSELYREIFSPERAII